MRLLRCVRGKFRSLLLTAFCQECMTSQDREHHPTGMLAALFVQILGIVPSREGDALSVYRARRAQLPPGSARRANMAQAQCWFAARHEHLPHRAKAGGGEIKCGVDRPRVGIEDVTLPVTVPLNGIGTAMPPLNRASAGRAAHAAALSIIQGSLPPSDKEKAPAGRT